MFEYRALAPTDAGVGLRLSSTVLSDRAHVFDAHPPRLPVRSEVLAKALLSFFNRKAYSGQRRQRCPAQECSDVGDERVPERKTGSRRNQRMNDAQSHWQNVWTTRSPEEVGWFEAEPAT